MKFPKLKIKTKDLPLFAIGVTAVIVSGLIKQPLMKYILIGMFFGVLSKETRWTYWGMFLLIEAFVSLKFLCHTDLGIMFVDTMMQIGIGLGNFTRLYSGVLDNSSLANAKEILVGLGNNQILNDPMTITTLSIISLAIGAILWVLSIILIVGYLLMLLLIFGHTLLMLYLFHRNELLSTVKLYGLTYTFPPYIARLAAPYLMQGMVIQILMMTAILPLIFYKILKRIGFYKRIPGIHS